MPNDSAHQAAQLFWKFADPVSRPQANKGSGSMADGRETSRGRTCSPMGHDCSATVRDYYFRKAEFYFRRRQLTMASDLPVNLGKSLG